jgi:glycosyl-4,4'-diaponeurosporenoate acyltransferase
MIWHLADGWQVLLSSFTWAAVSVVVGWWALRWSPERLDRPGFLTRLRSWEADGRWWERHLRVSRWKDRLPEAGAVMPGGRSMRHLEARTPEGLARFARESMRAERVHWLIWSSLVLHLLWCRPTVFAGMAVFAWALNAPFIVIQRSNRGRIDRLAATRAARLERRRAQP